MCRREGVSLQAGMNLGIGGNHSVILMSRVVEARRCICPFSLGGTSITAANVQLLCTRQDLGKNDRIT
jgi:hypothetical protein